jgi:OOP family OmpA-OmpF porin
MPDFIQQIFFTKFSDEDRDGVSDANDRCPGTPDDVNVNDDGCPVDSDGDGVFDYKDRCPDTPKQVKVDTFGCPIPVASKSATVTASGTLIYKGIQFETGKWDIKKESHGVLDEIVRTIQSSPNLKFEIQGHTDNMGSETSNYRLSERRAKAVMDYLTGKGVSPAQLTYKGYGSSMPITSNETPAGRSENRRVEFKPIQ